MPVSTRGHFCSVQWRCLRYVLFFSSLSVSVRLVLNGMKDFLLYLNHVGLCTEEISESGDAYVKFLFSLNCGA